MDEIREAGQMPKDFRKVWRAHDRYVAAPIVNQAVVSGHAARTDEQSVHMGLPEKAALRECGHIACEMADPADGSDPQDPQARRVEQQRYRSEHDGRDEDHGVVGERAPAQARDERAPRVTEGLHARRKAHEIRIIAAVWALFFGRIARASINGKNVFLVLQARRMQAVRFASARLRRAAWRDPNSHAQRRYQALL